MSLSVLGGYPFDNFNKLNMTPFEQEKLEEKRERMGIEDPKEKFGMLKDPLKEDIEERKHDKRSPDFECEACAHRKYQDGSNEMVSFKNATHIAPAAVASKVRAHEQEHVSNAYKKAFQEGAEVVSASVRIHTSICPECGRSYVSGGTTTTQIKYCNESNPYQKDLKLQDQAKYAGMNVDTGC